MRFADDDAVRRLAQRLASQAGRRLDDATPHVDVRLPDGTRLHAVLAPVSRPGTLISLRVPRARVFTLDELVGAGTVSAPGAELLRALVASRAAFLVSGGTGSGKTTLLSSLLSLVDPAERVVLVEDAAELRPDHPHVVGLEARTANVEGVGAIELRDPGPAGAADAAGPAGGGRGPGGRGRGPARGAQHRPRGRLRHPARQLGRRRAGPRGGAGPGRRPRPARRCTASWRRGSPRWSTSSAAATASAGSPRSRCRPATGPAWSP